jgi:hypothetical protein
LGGDPWAPGRNSEVDFGSKAHGSESRGSTTDPDAWLGRQQAGQSTKMCHTGRLLAANRHGLLEQGRSDAGHLHGGT